MFRSAVRTGVLLIVFAAASGFAADFEIVVGDNFFNPALLTIDVGDTVTWNNTGSMPHNVRADDNSFRNGNASATDWSYTRTFTTARDFRYYCELHGAAGGIGMSGMIRVRPNEEPPPPGPGNANVVVMPVSGSVRGSNNSFFRTFVRVFNPSSTAPVNIGVAFLPVAQNNSAAPEVVITVGPRESKVYEDIVGVLLGGSGLGAIRFHADAPFEVTGRIFTDSNCASPQGGTFGQFLRGSDASEALTKGVLLNLEWTPEFRTNIGFANPGLQDVAVSATLMGPNGVVGGPVSITLLARSATSPTAIRDVFGLPGLAEKNLYVTFEAPQAVFAYASALDNVTSDSVYIAPRPLN